MGTMARSGSLPLSQISDTHPNKPVRGMVPQQGDDTFQETLKNSPYFKRIKKHFTHLRNLKGHFILLQALK